MSDSDEDTLRTPHQASIRQKEQQRCADEIRNRIGALRLQVSKFDAIEYRKAQVAHDHQLAREFREQIKAEEEAYAERREAYVAENIELATAVKEYTKEALFNTKKQLTANKAASSAARRAESARHGEFLEAFGEEDAEWRRELRGAIAEARKTHAANREKFVEERCKAIKKEREAVVASRGRAYDKGTIEMADLILKEARIIRQLLKLREANAPPASSSDGADGDDGAAAAKKPAGKSL